MKNISLTTLILLVLFLKVAQCRELRTFESHKYWFNKYNPKYLKDSDSKWDYCDYKCIYL